MNWLFFWHIIIFFSFFLNLFILFLRGRQIYIIISIISVYIYIYIYIFFFEVVLLRLCCVVLCCVIVYSLFCFPLFTYLLLINLPLPASQYSFLPIIYTCNTSNLSPLSLPPLYQYSLYSLSITSIAHPSYIAILPSNCLSHLLMFS